MLRISSFLMIFLSFALNTLSQASSPERNPERYPERFQAVFLSDAHLRELHHRIERRIEPNATAFDGLIESLEARMNVEPNPPKHWYVPGYYRDAKGHTEAKSNLMNDANTAYGLALAYRMINEEKYAGKAAEIIQAWMHGVESWSKEDDSTLCFSYHFPAMILAVDLIRPSSAWTDRHEEDFKAFLRKSALPMNTMSRSNNWGNWGLVLVISSAVFLQDDDLFDQAVARWKEFIESQMDDEGHLTHEVNRSEGRAGIWYTHFSLMPQTIAAEIARVNGVDLYDYVSPGGHSLRLAFERASSWSRAPETFPYYKGNMEDLFGVNYVSYFELLNNHWPNEDATVLLDELRPLSARHSAPALTFTHANFKP